MNKITKDKRGFYALEHKDCYDGPRTFSIHYFDGTTFTEHFDGDEWEEYEPSRKTPSEYNEYWAGITEMIYLGE